jgi:uncharacterized membrane protein
MLKSKELRAKAWNSLKGKYWKAFLVIIVLGALVSIGTGLVTGAQTMMGIVNAVDPFQMDPTMQMGAAVISVAALAASLAGSVISIFVGHAATVGQMHYFIKNTNAEPSFADAFFGFKVKYGRNIGTLFVMGIKEALWSMLFVIPGIIKSYEYAIIPYILADDPEISSKDAFKKAKEMMKGNKWRLFKLNFSFIGWELLCILTLGLGTFFLLPYINAANAEFYAELKNR